MRKRHMQQALRFDGKKSRKPRRGRAKGGRPKKGDRASERHKKRPAFRKHDPQHVVIRTVEAIGNLRRRDMYKAVRRALITTFLRQNFRIVHLSIQGTHVHLLVEADHRDALSRGMQAFQISAAKHVNAAMFCSTGERRRGQVFIDRYHARTIRTPEQARNALAYVLKNASHCTYRGKRVEFPTSGSHTRLLQGAQRVLRYRRPSFEDFVWGWASMPLPGKIDFKVRYGPGVPEQLHS